MKDFILAVLIFAAIVALVWWKTKPRRVFIVKPIPYREPEKLVTPLADSLEGKLPPDLREPVNPLPPEKHIPKRSHHKKEK